MISNWRLHNKVMNASTTRNGFRAATAESESTAKTAARSSGQRSEKLRGMIKDTPEVRLSKTISWLLRHGAKSEGLAIRTDGCVRVEDLLANSRIKSQNVDFARLQAVVTADAKQRYALLSEPAAEGGGHAEETWWIKANQGHSITTVEVEMKSILSIKDIPSACAVHGTSMAAWKSIAIQGLSKMKRNHIHLAQGVSNDNVISGMRRSSQVFIYVDVQKAIDAGIKFLLSDNGVVLTSGDETGFLKPEYFDRVVTAKNEVLLERSTTSDNVVQPIVQGTSEIS